MDIRFEDIFSSRAKIKALQALFYQPEGIPLRHIAELCESAVSPIERAVKELKQLQVVLRTRYKNKTLYRINKSHPIYPVVKASLIAERNYQLASKAKKNNSRMQSAIQFADEMIEFWKQTKGKN